MTDDELERAHVALQRQRRANRTIDAPSPEQMQALVDGSLPASEREAVLDRVFASGATDDLSLLHAIASTSRTSSSPVVSTIRRFAPWAAAAALLLMVGIPVARLSRGNGEGEVRYRGADTNENVPTLAATRAASGSVMFSWSRVRDAERYTLEVLDQNSELVVRRETTDTTVTLPDSLLVATAGDDGKDWWVVAHLPSGGKRRSALGTIGAILRK